MGIDPNVVNVLNVVNTGNGCNVPIMPAANEVVFIHSSLNPSKEI